MKPTTTTAYASSAHGQHHHQQEHQLHEQQHQQQMYDGPTTKISTTTMLSTSTTSTAAASSQMDTPYGLAITQPQVTRRLDSAGSQRSAAVNSHQTQQQKQQQQQQQQQQYQQQLIQQRKQATSGSPIQRNNNGATQQQQQQQQQQQSSSGSAAMQRYQPTTEDTLEYFIKFPTPNYNTPPPPPPTHYQSQRASVHDYDGTESDYVFVCNEMNVPIVLLLGWAGCQDRYLMKYSKIYEDRGLITVRYTAPVDTLFWKRTAMVPIGEKILKLMYDMNFDGHPIVLHIFSNGGAYLYQHISLAMRRHNTPLQIRGMIFDSAPGERRMLGLYRAVSAIYGKERRKCNSLTAIVITLTLSLMWFVEETFAAFKSLFVTCRTTTMVQQTNPFNDLKNEPNQFPQLFLYSKADVVIPHTDVEKFISIRQQQGVDVSSVCFEDAEHVKIYTKYPTHYIHTVCTFINNCLSLPYKGVTAIFPNAETSQSNSLDSIANTGSSNSKFD